MCETFSPKKTLTVITKQKSRAETCNNNNNNKKKQESKKQKITED